MERREWVECMATSKPFFFFNFPILTLETLLKACKANMHYVCRADRQYTLLLYLLVAPSPAPIDVGFHRCMLQKVGEPWDESIVIISWMCTVFE